MTNPEPSSLLSPAFSRAQRISRAMAVVLAIGLGFSLFVLVALAVLLVWPDAGNFRLGDTGAFISTLPFGPRAGAIAGTVLGSIAPILLLIHARAVFLHFARGEIFAAAPIRHIQRAGVWLIVAPFGYAVEQFVVNYFAERFIVGVATTTARPVPGAHLYVAFLFIGIGVYVLAYVMSEAQRIAEDHASIV